MLVILLNQIVNKGIKITKNAIILIINLNIVFIVSYFIQLTTFILKLSEEDMV